VRISQLVRKVVAVCSGLPVKCSTRKAAINPGHHERTLWWRRRGGDRECHSPGCSLAHAQTPAQLTTRALRQRARAVAHHPACDR